MTPKEKAVQLYDKYFLLHESATDENGVWIVSALNKGLAKKCALIAVDEIIKSEPTFNSSIFQGSFLISDNTEYWEEVKQEIAQL